MYLSKHALIKAAAVMQESSSRPSHIFLCFKKSAFHEYIVEAEIPYFSQIFSMVRLFEK
jgi:hypothetical protein